ncbi:MAG: thioredoxin family protein [Cellulosilyticaceae bacterium]
MERLENYEQLKACVDSQPLVVVYFTGSACGACEVIKSKVEILLEKYPEVKGIEINGEKYRELATSFQVYALPLMLLFVEGKESVRVGRHVDLREFEEKIKRYSKLMI